MYGCRERRADQRVGQTHITHGSIPHSVLRLREGEAMRASHVEPSNHDVEDRSLALSAVSPATVFASEVRESTRAAPFFLARLSTLGLSHMA